MHRTPGKLSFIIRPATSKDDDDLEEIFLIARRQAFYWMDPQQFNLNDFKFQTEGESIYLAETPEHKLAGFISIWEPENFVHHLYVHPDYQNLGVGKKLVQNVVNLFGLPLRLKCLSKNTKALAFYFSQNWIEKGKSEGENGEYLNLTLDSNPKNKPITRSIPGSARLV